MESVSKTSDANLKGKWQWKSNSDPWSKTEEPQWASYSPEHNYLIEKAHYDKKNEVDLGNYVISIKHMRQNKKGNVVKQRPIRRITFEDDAMGALSERYFETELPKTINKIFGSLKDFITFFSRRNPEMLNFKERFEEIERLDDLNGLKKGILPKLINCLEEELLKPIENRLKDNSLSQYQKKLHQKIKGRHEELVSLLKKDFKSFEEFYGRILKSYTMDTSLYQNINKYLRNESWAELDNLLPYTICLCKAFFSFKLSKNHKDNKSPVIENSKILYRGTALDESALDRYQKKKASKIFSWYAVTSTSTNREMAEKFMFNCADIAKKKYPVLFIIEIPPGNKDRESGYLKWIDLKQYSEAPSEEEVILAPGTAFEIEQISTNEKDKTTIIKMKLKHEVESLAHEGLIMQGAFQSEMMSDKQVKIMCLEREELFEALKNISGNRLIEKIEFILCIFDQKSLKEMLLILSALKKVKGLKLISCKYEDKQEITSARPQNLKDCKIEDIEISEVQDIFKILSLNKKDDNFWGSLKTLNIDFGNIVFKNSEFWAFRFPTGLISLTLNFPQWCQPGDQVVKNLTSVGLKSLTQLASLTLNFSVCIQIKDEGISFLASKGLKNLTQLTSLTLIFSHCPQIRDEEVISLAVKGLKYLFRLTSLILDFTDCQRITDKGVSNLAFEGLKYLTQLTDLTLNFSDCPEIKDKGVHDLAVGGLQYLTQLTSLSLIFSDCPEMTDLGLNILIIYEFKSLTQLTSLTLNFSHCPKITDGIIIDFASVALGYFTQLTLLRLNDKVLKQTRQHHQIREDQNFALTSLCLNLTRPKRQNQPDFLVDDPLKSTQSFENSNFEISKEDEDEEIEKALNKFLLELMYYQCIKMQPISTLGPVSFCEVVSIKRNIDEKTMELPITSLEIVFQIYLEDLTAETHPLSENRQIKDERMSCLASQGFKYLTQLTSLILGFSDGQQITDEGMRNLALEGLKHLTQLTLYVFAHP